MIRDDTLTIRGTRFAYLFGPPRAVTRDEASRLHASVCDRLGSDDITFAYRRPEGQDSGFSVVIETRQEKEGFQLVLDNPQPMRLLISTTWPQSFPDVTKKIDEAAETVFEALDGNCHKVLAEVRIRAQCEVESGDALGFIREHLLRVRPQWIESDGSPLASCSVRLKTASSEQPPGELPGTPEREIVLEPLSGDPKGIYIEVVSKWMQLASQDTQASPAVVRTIRPLEGCPSQFLKESYSFIKGKLLRLGTGSREKVSVAH